MDLLVKGGRSVFYSTSLFGLCCVLNSLQIFSIPLWPFSSKLSYDINSYLLSTMWQVMQYIFEDKRQAKITFSGDFIPDDESAMVISNHRSWSDYYMINAVANRKNMLGHIRYFIKDSLKYLPFFGWGMYLMGMLFLKRDWSKDEKKIDATFGKLIRNKHPVWLVSYLEGSRFSMSKCIESQKFSQKNQLPVLNNVLFPRTKGFLISLSKLRNSHIEHVYDITMAYSHRTKGFGVYPSIVDIHTLSHLREYQFHIHVRRFSINELPEEQEKLRQWIIQLFVEKDELLERLKLGWTNALTESEHLRTQL
ncbi:acyltransferase-domain-containing protein [Neoconidiobolus thromboides FSU 785]|nr:acyltransferase-domain-containing protein [Neoconidiobolus thromboides FSU 785]